MGTQRRLATPILVADGAFDAAVAPEFKEREFQVARFSGKIEGFSSLNQIIK
jgi:hypothetical protein